jgi:hypothetical protein
MFGLSRSDKQWLSQQFQQMKEVIVTAAQNIIDAVTAELTGLSTPLTTILTEVNNLVSGQTVNTDALKAAADQVAAGVNAVATAAGAPPVVTPPSS